MPDPLKAVLTGVYNLLNNDATLNGLAPGGVWTGNANDDLDSYPYVAISLASADELFTYTQAYNHRHVLMIRGVDKSGDAAGVVDALARVYDLLNDGALSVSGFNVLVSRRQGRVMTEPVEHGVTYKNLVDTYGVEVNA